MSLILKAKNFFNRSIPSIKYLGLNHFLLGVGSRTAMLFNLKNLSKYLDRKHSRHITDYVIQHYHHLIIKDRQSKDSSIPCHIWTLWWQGIENAPESVILTTNSIKRIYGENTYKIIDKNNYNDFVNLPIHIIEKFNSGIISIQNFSDILRSALISQHGGFWLDANILLTDDILPISSHIPFWTTKNPPEFLWTGFCMGGYKENILTKSLFTIFCEYWKEHNTLIDYFLIDRIIQACYETSPSIKELIDSLPVNNKDIMFFLENLHSSFSEVRFKEVTSSTKIFKLTHKQNLTKPNLKYTNRLYQEYLRLLYN